MKNYKVKILNLILPVISVALIFIIWVVASSRIDNQYILPSVLDTAEKFVTLIFSKEFYLAFASTLCRSLIGFLVSFIIAFALAFLCYKQPVAKGIVQPLISITRALPTIAIVLLLLFWTNSKIAPIIVTILVVLPTSYTQLTQAFESIDKTMVEAGRVDGGKEWQLLLKVEYPFIAPAFYTAIGSGLSLNFKLMVAAEVIAQTANSIGYLLNTSKVYFEIAQMMALVVASVIFGVIVEFIFNVISKKLGDWR